MSETVTAGNVQLLAERLAGDASPFAPYVRSLPVGVEGLPMFFSAPAMKALEQYPPVSVQVQRLAMPECRVPVRHCCQSSAP